MFTVGEVREILRDIQSRFANTAAETRHDAVLPSNPIQFASRMKFAEHMDMAASGVANVISMLEAKWSAEEGDADARP